MAHIPAEQVIVRPVRSTDTEAFFRLIAAERDRLHTYFPVTIGRSLDVRATADYVTDLIAQAAAKETFCYVVFTPDGTLPVGVVFLKSFDHRVGKCEAAYFVGRAYHGRGIASNALAWAVDEAFRTHGLQRLFLRIDPENAASIRVAEKNGFEREGLLRRDFRTSDDRLLDVLAYGKLRGAH